MALCFPSNSKCEWSVLQHFVDQFNDQFDTAYKHVECLDVVDRNQPKPEVLLTDADGRCMVIERKSLVWPPDHLKEHQSEHVFADHFVPMVATSFQDDVYFLGIGRKYLHGSRKQVVNIAGQIAGMVEVGRIGILNAGQISSDLPVPWRFWRLLDFERDENTPSHGVGVMFDDPLITLFESFVRGDSIFDKNRELEIREGLSVELEKRLTSATLKFKDYPDCVRILVLEIYTDEIMLDVIAIDDIVQGVDMPSGIDQIWVDESWDSELLSYRQVDINYKFRRDKLLME